MFELNLKQYKMLSLIFLSNKKSFGVPPRTPLRTTGGTRTTGWEPLYYCIAKN
jgi:hypothetical protein